jgi:FkbM family methyltransferase
MRNVGRKLAFVLASTNHGAMIVNRFDYRMVGPDSGFGVGFQILERAAFDPVEVELAVQLLETRRRYFGEGAVEAQERLYYALAGNIALNNCFNAIAMHAAVSSESGVMKMPAPNYLTASSFGSLELRPSATTEFIGQAIDYSDDKMVPVQRITLDSLNLSRVDLIKIDIEGMEMEALEGARQLIEKCHPILLIEQIKAVRERLRAWIQERGYEVIDAGINVLAVHRSDPTLKELQAKMAEAQTQTSAA